MTNQPSGRIVVGIAECSVTTEPDAVLLTYALGSCIAVTAWDPLIRIGGLLHFMLPDSAMETSRGKDNPFLYADTGIPALLDMCVKAGAVRKRLIVRSVGGAQILNEGAAFNVGNRNHLSMRKALWKAGILLEAEATGGNLSRSVMFETSTGKVLIREGASPWRELIGRKAGTAR